MKYRRIVVEESGGYNIDQVEQLLNIVGISYTEESEETDAQMVSPTLCDGAQEQAIEPENLDKVELQAPFVRAQLSTKNQMILRNIIAILSSLGVVIVFILEKLGVM